MIVSSSGCAVAQRERQAYVDPILPGGHCALYHATKHAHTHDLSLYIHPLHIYNMDNKKSKGETKN